MWYSKSILIGWEAWEWRREFWLVDRQLISQPFSYTKRREKHRPWNFLLGFQLQKCHRIKQDSAFYSFLVVLEHHIFNYVSKNILIKV